MRLLDTIGRMMLGGSIRRALWRSPKARLIAAALVGLLLMSIGTARAQACNDVNAVTAQCATPGEARAALLAALEHRAAQARSRYPSLNVTACPDPGSSPTSQNGTVYVDSATAGCSYGASTFTYGGQVYRYASASCPADAPWNPQTGTCGTPNECGSKPNVENTAYTNYNASTNSVCLDGCTMKDAGLGFGRTIDGKEAFFSSLWEASGDQCTAGPGGGAEPLIDTDGDGTSDGNDSSPNNPGSGSNGPDGLGQPQDKDCGGEGQPECGEKGSGSGNGNSSGGGGNCKTPPSSTGDAILAQIAYQAWATRCAVEGLAKGDGNGDGQPDWTKGNGPAVEQDGTDYVAESSRFGIGLNPNILDQENIFGGGSCPAFSITVLSATVSTNDFPAWCSLIAPAMRGLILLMGAFTALGILLGRFGV